MFIWSLGFSYSFWVEFVVFVFSVVVEETVSSLKNTHHGIGDLASKRSDEGTDIAFLNVLLCQEADSSPAMYIKSHIAVHANVVVRSSFAILFSLCHVRFL